MDSVRGKLLLANGSLYGDAFRQTVILMADHDEEGALGFVLNRPTEMSIAPEGAATKLALIDDVVYSGGPVQQDALAVIAEFEGPEPEERVIFDAVGFLNLEQAGPGGVKRARVFAGYSGWGPQQLEHEIAEGSWLITEATTDLVFEVPPSELWRETLRRMGGRYAFMATMPYDPSVN